MITPGAHADPEPEAWSIWTASDESANTIIDHSAWGEFLGHYVQEHESGINLLKVIVVWIFLVYRLVPKEKILYF